MYLLKFSVMGKMEYKVSFKAEYSWFEINFSTSILVAISTLKSSVCPIYF